MKISCQIYQSTMLLLPCASSISGSFASPIISTRNGRSRQLTTAILPVLTSDIHRSHSYANHNLYSFIHNPAWLPALSVPPLRTRDEARGRGGERGRVRQNRGTNQSSSPVADAPKSTTAIWHAYENITRHMKRNVAREKITYFKSAWCLFTLSTEEPGLPAFSPSQPPLRFMN